MSAVCMRTVCVSTVCMPTNFHPILYRDKSKVQHYLSLGKKESRIKMSMFCSSVKPSILVFIELYIDDI